jgi:hypothetical protein
MGPAAKYKVNVADKTCTDVLKKINDKEVDNTLFVAAQKEVVQFMTLDVFPRYQAWAAENIGKGTGAPATEGVADIGDEGDRKAMSETVKRLMVNEVELGRFRGIASKQDAEESIDFYLDVLSYQKLFQKSDLVETANRLWKRYLDAEADRLVTLPDNVHKVLEKAVKEGNVDATTFDKALKETLLLLTDNIYPTYLREQRKSRASGSSDSAPAPAPPSNSGGCCVLL